MKKRPRHRGHPTSTRTVVRGPDDLCDFCGIRPRLKMTTAGKWACRKCLTRKRPIQNKEVKIGRNKPCPCGSGKKFKKCHMR